AGRLFCGKATIGPTNVKDIIAMNFVLFFISATPLDLNRSCSCNSCDAWPMEIPGRAVGTGQERIRSGGKDEECKDRGENAAEPPNLRRPRRKIGESKGKTSATNSTGACRETRPAGKTLDDCEDPIVLQQS